MAAVKEDGCSSAGLVLLSVDLFGHEEKGWRAHSTNWQEGILEGTEFKMSIPLPKQPIGLAQQIQLLDWEKCENNIHKNTGWRTPQQEGMALLTSSPARSGCCEKH